MSSPDTKRQKVEQPPDGAKAELRSWVSKCEECRHGGEVVVGPDGLRSWVSKALPSRFVPAMKEALLSSPSIGALDILTFVVEFVFGWSDVDIIKIRGYARKIVENSQGPLHHDDRIEALAFVTEWLGKDHQPDESSELPSLSRLCAQRIAMESFDDFREDLDNNFDEENLLYFTETLQNDIVAALDGIDIPEHLHGIVTEELFILAIVYFLYIDLRTLDVTHLGPDDASEIQLPAKNSSKDMWWWAEGMRQVLNSVSNHGRGSLAKVGVVSHAVCTSFMKKVVYENAEKDWYCHVDIILGHAHRPGLLSIKHPLAYQVALGPITTFLYAYIMTGTYYEQYWETGVIEQEFIPWILESGIPKRDCSSFSLLCLASKIDDPPLMNGPPYLRMDRSVTRIAVQNCLEAFDCRTLYDSLASGVYRSPRYALLSYHPTRYGDTGGLPDICYVKT